MGVFSHDDARCLGGTGLHPRQGEAGLEIGYWIAADEVGQGYATEISAVLTRVGFAHFGMDRIEIRVDPGNEISERVPAKLGFAKEATHSFEALARLDEFSELGRPLVVGPSRKSFLARPLGGKLQAPARDWATAAAVTAAVLSGAHVVRVHAVAEMVQVAQVADEIRRYHRVDS